MTLGPNFLQAICDPKIRTKSVSGRNPSLGGQPHEASWGHLETSFYGGRENSRTPGRRHADVRLEWF